MSADLRRASVVTEVRLLGLPGWRFASAEPFQELALRDACLLALLAIEGAVPRDRAAAWLWPDVAQANANLSLRQRVFRLRRHSGQALIDAGPVLRLAPGVVVDVQAESLPTDGELLAGLDFGASEAFDHWLRGARQSIVRRQADVLAGLAAVCETRGDLAAAIALCERIVTAVPATEHAWRRLMRLHWLRADRAAAIATFERFERQVCREHGIQPSAETLELLEQIERLEASVRRGAAELPPSLLRPPLLVGRAEALQAMDAAWTAGRALLLQATGGMGKSRLLEAFALGRQGLLLVRARPGDAAQPFDTLGHVLAAAIERFAPSLSAPTRHELARILPGLGAAPTSPAQGSRLRHAIEQAWLGCIRNGLAALLIDDVHWADPASLEQLHWQLASPALADLRCGFAARPDEETPSTPLLRDWVGDSSRVVPIGLPSWGEDELRILIDSLALTAASGHEAELAARLLRQTGGQPFFVLETLKTLCLSDSVLDAAQWSVPAPAVSAVIERRLHRLPAAARQLLQVLAVADGDLRLEAATRVLRRPLLSLAADWAELTSAQLVRHTGVAHDLVRECVLAGLPDPARSALHLALAEALAETPGMAPARLARHWQAAQAWPQAAQTWLEAARLAVGAGRLGEADSLFTLAADAGERAGSGAQLVEVLAAAQPSRLLCQGADAVAAGLIEHLQRARDPATRVRLLLLRAEAEMARMRFADAAAVAAQAAALVQGLAGETALKADVHLLHGRTLCWTDGTEEGLERMRLACAEIDALGDLRRRLQARTTLSDVLVPAGLRVESVKVQRDALLLARELGDVFELAVCAANLSLYHYLVGDADGAYAAAAEACQALSQMEAGHVNRLMCAAVFSYAGAHLGRFDEVEAEARAFMDPRDGNDGTQDPVLRNLRNVLATVALWRGQPDEADQLLLPDRDDTPTSVRVTGLQARLRWLTWTAAAQAELSGPLQALQAIGEQHPQLRDDSNLYRGWAPFDPPEEAVPRLDRLAERERAAGAHGMARSLSLIALQLALIADPGDAARRAQVLLGELPQGLHPSIYPPEAWWSVAEDLRLGGDCSGRRAALAHARDWIEQARLPNADAATLTAFFECNPVNRRVLAATDRMAIDEVPH